MPLSLFRVIFVFQICDESHIQKRTRFIVRKPMAPAAFSCPLLEEKLPCVLNDNCFNYSWNLTEWTTCTIPDGATCGEGIKQRGVVCQRSDGRSVEEELCQKVKKKYIVAIIEFLT